MIRHRAAVLGHPIEHSLSPVLHNAGYQAAGLDDWEYTRIDTTEDTLAEVVGTADESFRGFSVTMPGKFAALTFATEMTDRARAIGSANTLTRIGGGWRADNTDCDGITGALGELLKSRGGLDGGRAVVVGSGGTARPALWALRQAGVSQVTVINRRDRSAELAPLLEGSSMKAAFVDYSADLPALTGEADVLISTVPSAALDGHGQRLAHCPILDVIYDPWPTPLTKQAAANGWPVVGGSVMLAHQSFPQFEQFTGVKAPCEEMRRALDDELARR